MNSGIACFISRHINKHRMSYPDILPLLQNRILPLDNPRICGV
jgi:hypothetical protein